MKKRIIMQTAEVIIFAVLFGVICKLINYCVVDDTKSYTRQAIHELYVENEGIDTLFVGSSHVERAVNPQIINEKTGAKSFNLGSSYQQLDGSLAMIKEACKYHDIKCVYLELYYEIAEGYTDRKDRTQMRSTNILSDYMRPSINKYAFILGAGDSSTYITNDCSTTIKSDSNP